MACRVGFMIMELVSGLSLANHSDSGSFRWPAHCSAKMDSSERDSGRLAGHMNWRLTPFDFSQVLPVGGSFRVPYQGLLL